MNSNFAWATADSLESAGLKDAGHICINFVPACCGCTGCNFAIRPTTGDGVYEYCHFADSHFEICVHNADGSKKETIGINMGQGDEPWGTTWTNHVDYLLYNSGESMINPVLFDLVGQRWVAFEDDGSGEFVEYGRPSGVFIPKAGVDARKTSVMVRHAPRAAQKLYSIDGRLLPNRKTGVSPSAVRSLRIPVGNQAAAVIIGSL